MNPTPPPNERAQLESRLTALLLGETAPEEAAVLRQQMAQDPALAALHQRLRLTLDLVRETAATTAGALSERPAPLKLSPSRREALLASFKTIRPKELARPRRRRVTRLIQLAAAAAILLTLASLLLPRFAKSKSMAMSGGAAPHVNALRFAIGKAEPKETLFAYMGLAEPASPTPSTAPGQIAGHPEATLSQLQNLTVPSDVKLIDSGAMPVTAANPSAPPKAAIYTGNSGNAFINDIYDYNGSATVASEGVNLQLQNVTVDQALNYLGEKAGFTIHRETSTAPASIPGTVDLVSDKPLTTDETVGALNKVLASHNLTAIQDGKNLTVMTIEDARANAGTPVQIDNGWTSIPADAQLVTEVIPVHSLDPKQVVTDLSTLIPPMDVMNTSDAGNAIVMTGTKAEVQKMSETVKALDGTGNGNLGVFATTYADSKALARELNEVFADNSGGGGVAAIFGNAGGRGGGGGGASDDTSRRPGGTFKAVSDDQNNTVLISAPTDFMPGVSNIIAKLDIPQFVDSGFTANSSPPRATQSVTATGSVTGLPVGGAAAPAGPSGAPGGGREMEERSFHVDPNAFKQGTGGATMSGISGQANTTTGGAYGGYGGGMGGYGGGSYGGSVQGSTTFPTVDTLANPSLTSKTPTSTANQPVINYFQAIGVDLTPTKNDGSFVIYNDKTGDMLVRAPKDQLDKVDRTVQSLNEPKQKVEIDTQFATVSQTDTKGLNFGLDLGNFAVGKGAVGLVGGTASSYQGSPTVNNPSGVFPGPGPVALSAGKIAPSASDAELTAGVRSFVPSGTSGNIGGLAWDAANKADEARKKNINDLSARDGVAVGQIVTGYPGTSDLIAERRRVGGTASVDQYAENVNLNGALKLNEDDLDLMVPRTNGASISVAVAGGGGGRGARGSGGSGSVGGQANLYGINGQLAPVTFTVDQNRQSIIYVNPSEKTSDKKLEDARKVEIARTGGNGRTQVDSPTGTNTWATSISGYVDAAGAWKPAPGNAKPGKGVDSDSDLTAAFPALPHFRVGEQVPSGTNLQWASSPILGDIPLTGIVFATGAARSPTGTNGTFTTPYVNGGLVNSAFNNNQGGKNRANINGEVDEVFSPFVSGSTFGGEHQFAATVGPSSGATVGRDSVEPKFTPSADSFASYVTNSNYGVMAFWPLSESNDPSSGITGSPVVAYDVVGGFNGVYGVNADNGDAVKEARYATDFRNRERDTPSAARSATITENNRSEAARAGLVDLPTQGALRDTNGLAPLHSYVTTAASPTIPAASTNSTIVAWIYPTTPTNGALNTVGGGFFNLGGTPIGDSSYTGTTPVTVLTTGGGQISSLGNIAAAQPATKDSGGYTSSTGMFSNSLSQKQLESLMEAERAVKVDSKSVQSVQSVVPTPASNNWNMVAGPINSPLYLPGANAAAGTNSAYAYGNLFTGGAATPPPNSGILVGDYSGDYFISEGAGTITVNSGSKIHGGVEEIAYERWNSNSASSATGVLGRPLTPELAKVLQLPMQTFEITSLIEPASVLLDKKQSDQKTASRKENETAKIAKNAEKESPSPSALSAVKSEPKNPVVRPATAPIIQSEVQTSSNAFSTFSLNVSDVSFKLAATSLQKGLLPDPAAIRTEEFINACDYRGPEPAPGAAVGFNWERAGYPFAHNRDLLRFAVKTATEGRQAGRPLNLVLLLDKSGSMERADRVGIIHEALRVLASQLGPQDTLSVVIFSRTARLMADGVPGNQAGKLAAQLDAINPEGGTNLEEAMRLAYEAALRHYLANGENRVVLLTDGAANLGDVDPDQLKKKVEANRAQGIALDCFGVGWEEYNDTLLEVLSRSGGGRYGFVNTPEEAATEFAGQLAGALRVAASDVKVQVEFNSNRIISWRQLGYAKDQLTKEQFRDNSVKAAQLAVAESGNALYTVEVNPAGDGPICTVYVRYRTPGTSDYSEHAWAVPYEGASPALDQASPAMRLAATASAFSEWLAGTPYAAEVTLNSLQSYLRGVPEFYGADARPKQLETMLREARSITGQ